MKYKKSIKMKKIFNVFSFNFSLLEDEIIIKSLMFTPTCPGQCSASYTLDYRKYCTCPILYFVLSLEYVRHLPHFNRNFYSGLLANILTNPTMTDSPVTPLLRSHRKTSLLVTIGQVGFLYIFFGGEER